MAFGKKKTSDGGGSFKYKERDADAYAKRANVGGMREGFLVEGIKMFSPKAGDHSVRILPPSWPDPEHYGLDVYVHYDIGPDGGAYLCLKQMKDEDCAICDARKEAIGEGEEDLARALGWTRRVLCWVIDRNNESDGPLCWSMPQTLDKEIASVCVDKKTGEVYSADHPTKGYDVSFEREGEKMKTKYVGVQLDRKPSPLSDDADEAAEWLAFIKENPIPDQLLFQEADYIETLVSGGLAKASRRGKDDDDDAGKKKGKKKAADDDDDDEPRKGKKKAKAEVDLTWEDVHALDEDELEALAEEHDVDVSDADDEAEAAALICAALDIDKPSKKKKAAADDDDDDPPAASKKKKKPAADDDDDDDAKKPAGRLAQLRNRRGR